NVALQQAYVLVVDFRRIGAGERACLAPAKERAPCPGAEFTAAVSTFEAHGVSAPSLRNRLRCRDPPEGRAGRRGRAGGRRRVRRGPGRGRGRPFASWPKGRIRVPRPAPSWRAAHLR